MALSTWNLDPAHAGVNFSTRHMMIMTVRGQFKKVSGVINFDPENVANSSVEATIDAASIETGVADRDNHLRSADFLDAANFPTLTFKSTKVEPLGNGKAKVTGDLTIRGITREVVVDAEHLGVTKNPWGVTVAVFNGSTTINREDWGLTWNVAIEAGGVLVGKDITITLDVEANPAPVAENAAQA